MCDCYEIKTDPYLSASTEHPTKDKAKEREKKRVKEQEKEKEKKHKVINEVKRKNGEVKQLIKGWWKPFWMSKYVQDKINPAILILHYNQSFFFFFLHTK